MRLSGLIIFLMDELPSLDCPIPAQMHSKERSSNEAMC